MSSSMPSTLPVMSNSCWPFFPFLPITAEKRIVTTVGVVAKYIMTVKSNVDACDRYAVLTEDMPAVRQQTAWNNAFQTLSIVDMLAMAGESWSCHNITDVATTLSAMATSNSHNVCTAGNMCVKHLRGCSNKKSSTLCRSDLALACLSSNVAIKRTMIGNPVLPRTTKAPIVFSRIGLEAKSMADEGVIVKPLFWNAETVKYKAW
mmetsp:Transcript_45889/g.121217  ORF Transcript_45889/g.121217 Transcript_45889/m.121217 type:complete len:205 (+) Transcript_45889:70-684(+)